MSAVKPFNPIHFHGYLVCHECQAAARRIAELTEERDRARDMAIGCISGDVHGWSDEHGDMGDGTTVP